MLVQLRVGGLQARLRDETIPPRFGCIGQETTGPGGFAKALRTVPVVLGIAEDTARLGAEGAWLLDFTNPAGLVTQALIDHGHRAIGLCNIPIGFQRMLAKQLGVEPAAGAARARRPQPPLVGAEGDGGRRRPAARADRRRIADQLGEEVDLPGDLVRLTRAIPSYYLRYFYLTGEVRREAGRRASAGRRGDGDRARACWRCTATRRST